MVANELEIVDYRTLTMLYYMESENEIEMELKHNLLVVNESQTHRDLKELAMEFLIDLGCKDILEEYVLHYSDSQFSRNFFRCDVVGSKEDGTLIAVECGGVARTKLLRMSQLSEISEIYILPYGETKPYKWKRSIRVCKECGHRK